MLAVALLILPVRLSQERYLAPLGAVLTAGYVGYVVVLLI